MYFKSHAGVDRASTPIFFIKATSKFNAAEKLAQVIDSPGFCSSIATFARFNTHRIGKDEFEFVQDAIATNHNEDESVWW
jgi:hypothetical protein